MDVEQWVHEFITSCNNLGWGCSEGFAASYYLDKKDMPPQAVAEKVISYKLDIPGVFWHLKR